MVKETMINQERRYMHMTGERQYRMFKQLSDFSRLVGKFWKHNFVILEPHFAATYWDTSFIVTDFVPHPQIERSDAPHNLKEQLWVFGHLASLFGRIKDVGESNSFYDRQNGKIILNDPGRELYMLPIRAAIYCGKAFRYAYRKMFAPERTWQGKHALEKEEVLNTSSISLRNTGV